MALEITKKVSTRIDKFFSKPVNEQKARLHLENQWRALGFEDLNSFIDALVKNGIVHKFLIDSQYGKKRLIYANSNDISPYEAVNALWARSYLCNLTAIFYHNLSNQVPQVIYVAREGKGRIADDIRRRKKIVLSDAQIFQAFIKPHRITKNRYSFKDTSLIFTERVDRGEIGIDTIDTNNSFLPEKSRVTSIERTLIDACVNPHYNGGIVSVVNYFREAKDRINAKKLINIYRNLAFTYPYWQAIGFICDSVNIKKVADGLYDSYKPKNKFYLDHDAKTSWCFNEKWQIYHPEIV